jgi:hypothetical protein
MTSLVHSVAVVELDRPARYGKQLVSHLGRRHGGEWSPESASGWIDLDGPRATVDVCESGLVMNLEAPNSDLDRLEEILGGHLVRFVGEPAIVVTWERSHDTTGTRQQAEQE